MGSFFTSSKTAEQLRAAFAWHGGLPLNERGHRAEDGVGVAAGEEAEFGATVIEEIELGVVGAHLELLLFVVGCEGDVDAAVVDGHDCGEERVGNGFPSGDVGRVVKEEPADATLFIAVGDEEIVFCGFGKLVIEVGSKRLFGGGVEVVCVFVTRKSHRGEVIAAAKPRFCFCFDIPDVHVDCWGKRVVHVGDEADPGCKKRA